MKKNLLRLTMLCFMAMIAIVGKAETITAKWDFTSSANPRAVAFYQGSSGTVASDKDGIVLTVDATSGKFDSTNRTGDAQVNNGTIIKVPVISTNDQVTIVGNYSVNYTIGKETDVTDLNKTYTATSSDVTAGFVTITATGSTYFYSITVVQDTEGPKEDATPTVSYADVTATWDFEHDCAGLNKTSSALTTINSDVKGIFLTLGGGTTRDNGNSYQFQNGVTIQIPVKTVKDVITIVGYPGYTAYTIGSDEGTGSSPDVTHKVTSAEVTQGYAVLTAGNNCYIKSISVIQRSGYEEKPLYTTDFNDWTPAKAATSESSITQKTKYSDEELIFTLYNTEIRSVEDSKFASYTTLPHIALMASKAADPYVTTSKLANISKVRYIHGATGGSRGWKLEAKGDGDTDWVVISSSYADPAGWCEVSKEINKQNVQLRWTNLNSSQNAYMFELDIYGMVDMSKAPILDTFEANGETYTAGDIFDQDSEGNYVATIEVSKTKALISESNPISKVVAANGEIGTITYATTGTGTEQKTIVTIPVTANGETVKYLATFIFKPDFTLTYYNTDGTTAMGTQTVEKDAKIATFEQDYTKATAAEGYKVRGWFVSAKGGRKYTTDEVITGNTSLYAVQTPIEVESESERYTFNLYDQYFYAEDHEAFNPEGNGKFHDTTHGWVFGNGDKVNLLVGGDANIVLSLCQYSGGKSITLTNAAGEVVSTIENDKVSTDGSIGTLSYKGGAGTVTLNFNGTSYLHKLVIANQKAPLYSYDSSTSTYTVVAGKASGFLGALDEANGSGDVTIYLPNGTYDLGNACLTTVSGKNITIKGESQTGTVIVNEPEKEGIGITATLLNTSQYLTLENLTLKNAYPYYDPSTGKAAASAGRAVCLQDKGNYTVCKNVTMLSYQDTYYSNNSAGYFYFGNCDIHGLVDFVCGGGDVFYENTTFTLESREMEEGKGDVTIAAPNGAKKYGYVMSKCIVDCKSATFNWGRSWGSVSNLAWLNTTLKQPDRIITSRFTAAGMNSAADGFYEYKTLNENGDVISPTSNVIKFTHSTGNKEYETILTEEQAANYTKEKVFADAPEEFRKRVGATPGTSIKSIVSNTLSESDGAIYNLQGVRVSKPTKGIYIINGKKVIVK